MIPMFLHVNKPNATKIAPGKNPQGFTLIELMVVIGLIAILSVVTAPSFAEHVRNTSIRSAAYQIASDLNLAKTQAIKSGSSCSINFFKPGDQYSVTNPSRTVTLTGYRGDVAFTDNPDGASPDVFTAMISFTSRGFASASGQVYLINQDNLIYRIQTSAAGGVAIHKWNGASNKWY